MKEHHRKFGKGASHPIPVWSGILEHREKMGPALWEFLWCLDRITKEQGGVGFVHNGAPVKAQRIAQDLSVDKETTKRNLQRLVSGGYLRLRRTPYGYAISVMNSLKFAIWAPHKRSDRNVASLPERDDKNVASEPRETTKVSSPETTRMSRTKKTQQTTRSRKKNPLYEKEGFSEFWKEYPRNEDKLDAAKAWAKIDPEEHSQVMAGLKRWKRSEQWQQEGGRFILYAVRFLKKERWKEIPPGLQPARPLDQEYEELARRRAGQVN